MKNRFLLALGLAALATATPLIATNEEYEDQPNTADVTKPVYSDAGNIPIKIAVNDVGQEKDDDQGIEVDDIDGAETVSLKVPDLSLDQKKKSLLI